MRRSTQHGKGAIIPLGAWVLRESCEVIGALSKQVGRPLELAVNVSPRQLSRPGFANSVRQTLSHARFPAELLTLEITETALISPDADTARALQELDSYGVGIVLDDFGIADDRVDHAIVAGVIDMGQAMGYTVTAEGVETHSQRDALRALACDRAQGFLLAQPMTAAALVGLAD